MGKKRRRQKTKTKKKKKRIHEDERRIRLQKYKKIILSQSVKQTPNARTKTKVTELTAPAIMDIFKNSNEVILFFKKMTNVFKKGGTINFNLKRVTQISPETILYMLSQIKRLKSSKRALLKGNFPDNEGCRELLIESGFFDHLRISVPFVKRHTKFLKIKNGKKVEAKIAAQVEDFAKYELNRTEINTGVYISIIECMANVNNHAYEKQDIKGQWWLMALKHESENRVSFAILDDGLGIPYTIHKKLFESYQKSASTIIKEVMMGESVKRSGTKQPERGLGLNKIYMNYVEGKIENLKVLSGNALLNFGKNEFIDISSELKGTVITWDYGYEND